MIVWFKFRLCVYSTTDATSGTYWIAFPHIRYGHCETSDLSRSYGTVVGEKSVALSDLRGCRECGTAENAFAGNLAGFLME